MSRLSLVVILLAIAIALMLYRRRGRRVATAPPPAAIAESHAVAASAAAAAPRREKSLAVSLHGSLFRYQDKGFVRRGNDFYRVFIDGAWKWKGQQRYAGVYTEKHIESSGDPPHEYKINVGHYFARGQQGARAEMLHYTTKEELAAKYALLEVDAQLDNVLDLTDLQVIREVADASDVSGNIWDILKELIGEETGGGDFPTVFGYYASRRGYSAILTFSARALHPEQASQLRQSDYWDDVMEDMVKGDVIEKMQRQTNRQCVVVLSGSLLTRLVKRYRYDDGPWEDNPLFGKSAEEIDALWAEFGPDFQASQGRVSYIKNSDPSGEDESAPPEK
jgi:hypothetical protein